MTVYDLAVIGGGIIGISSVWQLKRRYPDAAIVLIEKEASLAAHQTGHNSGVIHAGVYYQPGSLKAEFCKRGALQTIAFCREHGLLFDQCGKLLVATDEIEYSRMKELEDRCLENGILFERLEKKALQKLEPSITGMAALRVPATGITDYRSITQKMAELFVSLGGEIRTRFKVRGIEENHCNVSIQSDCGKIEARYLLACGGLSADRLAKMTGIDIDFQIVPFRGEYYQLPPKFSNIVKHLIYPVPDPDLPFLGIHLTRMIDGTITVGPNAVLGWKREGYGHFNFDLYDSLNMLTFAGFWKVAWKNRLSGLNELKDSIFKSGYLNRVKKYCPQIALDDLKSYPAGIRAQAVRRDGNLVHDFLFAESDNSMHVCNAPSPAATSAIPIGEHICNRISEKIEG